MTRLLHTRRRLTIDAAIAALLVAPALVTTAAASCGQTYLDAILMQEQELDGGQDASCAEGLIDCSGTCVDIGSDSMHCGGCGNVCSTGSMCDAGSCVCPGGRGYCNGSCVNILTSNVHCGACGTPCQLPTLCVDGGCTCVGLAYCDGTCVSTNLDPNNCGMCGNACPIGSLCINGVCL